jgi:hypothetical protein
MEYGKNWRVAKEIKIWQWQERKKNNSCARNHMPVLLFLHAAFPHPPTPRSDQETELKPSQGFVAIVHILRKLLGKGFWRVI